jgi:hypothetical protein
VFIAFKKQKGVPHAPDDAEDGIKNQTSIKGAYGTPYLTDFLNGHG